MWRRRLAFAEAHRHRRRLVQETQRLQQPVALRTHVQSACAGLRRARPRALAPARSAIARPSACTPPPAPPASSSSIRCTPTPASTRRFSRAGGTTSGASAHQHRIHRQRIPQRGFGRSSQPRRADARRSPLSPRALEQPQRVEFEIVAEILAVAHAIASPAMSSRRRLQRAPHPGFHGPQRLLHPLRHLGLRQAFVIGQLDHLLSASASASRMRSSERARGRGSSADRRSS